MGPNAEGNIWGKYMGLQIKSAENPGAAEESEEKRAQEAAGQATPGYKSDKL